MTSRSSNIDAVRGALAGYNAGEGDDMCDGIRTWLHSADTRFDQARLEQEEISEIDSSVLMLGRLVVDPGANTDGSQEFGLVCECSDGRVVHWSPYLSHKAAILAAEMLEC